MKLLHKCIVIGSVLLTAASCSKDAPWGGASGDEGKISLKLKTDYSVNTSTRASDTESPVKPNGEEFRIHLENSDGSYVKDWDNLNKFNGEEGFPRGVYTVTASYGSLEEQGFTKPHYTGSERITVVAGETTTHSITASLANSMVSVRYTDNFLRHFSQFSASLKADGISTPVVFPRNEERPAYVKPGNIKVSFTIYNNEGQEVTVQPSEFTAVARRHYIVTADVSEAEEHNVAVLQVLFEEDVDKVTHDIILSDEVFTAAAPEIKASGFEMAKTLETFESVDLENSPEFHVIAFGGITSAEFTVELLNNRGTLPAFGSNIDLVNVNAEKEAQMESAMLKCYGFKPAEGSEGNSMAVIKMKEFIENLEPGEYKISLTVTDGLGRVTDADAAYFNTTVNRIEYKLLEDEAVVPKFMSNELSVLVSTNYTGAVNEFTFDVEDVNGDPIPARIKSAPQAVQVNAPYENTYRFTLEVDDIDDAERDVYLNFPKRETEKLTVKVDIPTFSVDLDAFGSKVMIKIIPDSAEDLPALINKAKFYSQGHALTSDLTRDLENGIITVGGLTPSTLYDDFYISYGRTLEGNHKKIEFSTENSEGVPNGDFEDLEEKINATINQGGRWTITATGSRHQTTLTMTIKEPKKWVSSNSITCGSGFDNTNSWFYIPSVYNTSLEWVSHQPNAKVGVIGQSAYNSTASIYTDNSTAAKGKNAMVVRNVAWDKNGKTPSDKTQTGNTDFSNYFCSNTPGTIANRSRGYLYLGDNTKEGVTFTTRPSVLTGWYKYLTDAQDSNEKGLVKIEILSGNDVIGSGYKELNKASQYTSFEIPITYIKDIFKKKATLLKIYIYSSNKESDIKTTNYCNKEECCSRGASLFIDALDFAY